MSISESLTPRANDFLEENSPRWLLNKEASPISGASLSPTQADVVTRLWGVSYESKSSFQEHRFEVSFFPSNNDEDIGGFVRRRGFFCDQSFFISGCNTDEAHFPDGIVLGPGGELVVPREGGPNDIVYESVCKVIERDAFLNCEAWEYQGSINFNLDFDWRTTSSLLTEFTNYEPASDCFNRLLHSEDIICLIQSWVDIYTPSFIPKEVGSVVRVFGHAKSAFDHIVTRLSDVTHSFAECERNLR